MKMSDLSKYCGTRDVPPVGVPTDRLNLPCCDGQTLLGNAADRGNVTRIKELINRGANPNGIDLHGQPPLIVATLSGKNASVSELLDLGANPDEPDTNGRTALMYSLYFGHLNIARELKSSGARQSVRDFDGRTAADYAGHKAVGKDMKATVEFIESLGVDPKAVKAKLSPMRSDPDFVALEYVKRLGAFALLRLAAYTWIGLAVLEQLSGLDIFWNGDAVLYSLPSWLSYPVIYMSPELIGFKFFGWGHGGRAFVFLFGWLVPFALLLWPILWRRRIARNTDVVTNGTINFEDTLSSISTSDSSARGVANILKQGGRQAFDGLKLERPEKSTKRRYAWIAFVAVLLVPWVFGLIQKLVLHKLLVTFLWYPQWYQLVPLSIASLFLMYFGWRGLASFAFSSSLIAKQTQRNTQMSKHLNDRTEFENPSRDYILYLRAFAQDGAVRLGNFDFEAVLTYSLSEVSEVVALGDQTGRFGPVELATDDETWENRVLELAQGARLVIMVPAATKSVAREVQILKDNGLLSKCLFIAPPEDKAKSGSEQADRWVMMLSFGIFATLDIPAYVRSGFLFRLDESGQLQSWDALGLQLEPPPIVAGLEFNDSADADYSSDFDPSISDGGWDSGSLADMTAAVIAQEQAAMDQDHAHHMQNDDWDDHHNM